MAESMIGQKPSRLSFIDVAKGVLMIMVIFHHIPQCFLQNGENSYLKTIDAMSFVYSSFFMASFFILSGFCSNFNKPFIPFSYNNIRALIVPSFVFTVISVWSKSPMNIVKPFSTDTLLYLLKWGGQFWFLPAMFLSREIYWIIRRYLDNFLYRLTALLFLLFIGIYLAKNDAILNIWRFKHALIFVIFLGIGQIAKFYKPTFKMMLSASLVFILLLSFFLFRSVNVPTVTLNICVNVYNLPFFIIFSVSGTAIVVLFSYWIEQSATLEFIGRYSIAFYITHPICLQYSVFIFSPLLCYGGVGLSAFYIFNILTCLLSAYLVVTLFSNLRLQFLIGK